MSNIVPFVFEGHKVTVVRDDDGALHFVAKEVAEILGYSDAYEMTKRLDEEEKQNRQIAGFGNRGVTVISESGLYDAILGSNKPEAKPFQKWVRAEVLPSIRKTGGYTATNTSRARVSDRYREAAAIAQASIKLCKLMGVETKMARVITADLVNKESGVDCTPMLGGNIAVEEVPVTPSKLGESMSPALGGKKINALLLEAGLQTRNEDGSYALTDAGKEFGVMEPFKSPHSQHVGHRPMWYAKALDPVRLQMAKQSNVVLLQGAA